MPGIGTYFFDSVRSELFVKGGLDMTEERSASLDRKNLLRADPRGLQTKTGGPPGSPALSTSEPPARKAVTFTVESKVRYIEESAGRKTRKWPNIVKQLFERFDGRELTDNMLQEAAQLFNDHYGIWGKDPTNPRPAPKPGSREKLSKNRLRAQYLPDNANCSYVRVTVEDRLAGNAFACRWSYKNRTVCWVTQLVVHSDFRERGLATHLLIQLRHDDDAIYGIMSSHPAACLAAAQALRSGINTGFIRDIAEAMMKASPIGYVKDAELRGNLFDPAETSGIVSSVDTRFFVDHTEPLKALAWVRTGLDWPLGELLDGYEFFLILAVRCPDRSRSSSRPLSGS
ncbi:hypothetical protein MMC29_006366 [Sticta canariensis]|nr:hypothetical protein [Sticta canariensis]